MNNIKRCASAYPYNNKYTFKTSQTICFDSEYSKRINKQGTNVKSVLKFSTFIKPERISKPFKRIKSETNLTLQTFQKLQRMLPQSEQIKKYLKKKYKIDQKQPQIYQKHLEGFYRQKLEQIAKEKQKNKIKSKIKKIVNRKIFTPTSVLHSSEYLQRNKFNLLNQEKVIFKNQKKIKNEILMEKQNRKLIRQMLKEMFKIKSYIEININKQITPELMFGDICVKNQQIYDMLINN